MPPRKAPSGRHRAPAACKRRREAIAGDDHQGRGENGPAGYADDAGIGQRIAEQPLERRAANAERRARRKARAARGAAGSLRDLAPWMVPPSCRARAHAATSPTLIGDGTDQQLGHGRARRATASTTAACRERRALPSVREGRRIPLGDGGHGLALAADRAREFDHRFREAGAEPSRIVAVAGNNALRLGGGRQAERRIAGDAATPPMAFQRLIIMAIASGAAAAAASSEIDL